MQCAISFASAVDGLEEEEEEGGMVLGHGLQHARAGRAGGEEECVCIA